MSKGYRQAAAGGKPTKTRSTSAHRRWRTSCRFAQSGVRKPWMATCAAVHARDLL